MTRLSAFQQPFAARGKSSVRSISQWSAVLIRTGRLIAIRHQANLFLSVFASNRSLAQVRPESFSELWFTASFPASSQLTQEHHLRTAATTAGPPEPNRNSDHRAPDERTLKLGKTLRALSPLLPNILTTPLPNALLSPNITLHLFPSTHPHLPVVRGRVACRAALWTAPVAWGSVPIVGNVKLEIQSEKIVRTGFVSAPTTPMVDGEGLGEEKLVVRWRTERKFDNGSTNTTTSPTSLSSATDNGGTNRGLSTLLGGNQPLFKSASSEPFMGLFVFSFDKDGKIASMTIEHADESHGCDKTSRMVTLTDWLLGRAKWGRAKEDETLIPGLAMSNTAYSRRWAWLKRGRSDRERNDYGRRW